MLHSRRFCLLSRQDVRFAANRLLRAEDPQTASVGYPWVRQHVS